MTVMITTRTKTGGRRPGQSRTERGALAVQARAAFCGGALLCFLWANASAQTLIVGNKNEDTISFIDLASGQERARVETGRAPHEIAVSPDGRTAVVVSYRAPGFTGDSLHLFDVASGAKTGTISLAPSKGPHGLKWIPDTDHVLATTELTEDVVIVDITGRAVIDRIATHQQGSHMVALSPDGARAIVSNIGSGGFTAIDLEGRKKRADVSVGEGTEAIAVSPDGAHLWVGANVASSVTVYEASSLKRLKHRTVEGVPIRIEIAPDGAHAAVSIADRAEVLILDTESLDTVATIDLVPHEAATPVTMLFSPQGDALWVAATGSARIVEIATGDWSVTRTLAAGRGSDGLGYSPISLATADARPAGEDNAGPTD